MYGDAETYPTPESVRPRPVSPYGVTKLAGENLCELYRMNLGIPTVSLRLFTVYGPRQRPDMAFSRLVRAAVLGTEFELFGDGEQTRDFTYVADVVRAMQDASRSDWSTRRVRMSTSGLTVTRELGPFSRWGRHEISESLLAPGRPGPSRRAATTAITTSTNPPCTIERAPPRVRPANHDRRSAR